MTRWSSCRRSAATTPPTTSSPAPAGASFEQAAPGLRARLADEDLSRRIEEWVKELRRSAEIRYNTTPEAGRS